ARQRGFDLRREVLAAGGEHQHRLGLEVHRLVQQQLAQALAERRAAGLAGVHHVDAAGLEQGDRGGDLGALAGAVDALEGDETAAGRGRTQGVLLLRMKRSTARLWSASLRENSLLPSP